MVSGLGVLLDAVATLDFFFWEPRSSLDFLFLLVTSAILKNLRKKVQNFHNEISSRRQADEPCCEKVKKWRVVSQTFFGHRLPD